MSVSKAPTRSRSLGSAAIAFVASAAAFATACGSSKPSAAPAIPSEPAPSTAPAPTASTPEAPAAPAGPTKPVTTQSLAAVGLDADAIDRSVDPCDDFYQFACGGWVQRTEIPADKPIAMRSFVDIEDRNLEYQRTLLERLRANPGNDPAAQKLGAYYGACMDEDAIEKAGIAPLRTALAAIDRVKDVRTLTAAIAALHGTGVSPLFDLRQTQDAADARNVIAEIDQGGIGLPDRDYYLKTDEQTVALRTSYQTYVEHMLAAIGRKTAKADAAAVVALETELARVAKDKVERRNPRGMYNKIDRAGVARTMPSFDWSTYWVAVGLGHAKDVNVTAPAFLAGVDRLLTATKPEVWRAYLAFHLVSDSAPFLTRQLEEIQFKFESALTGQPEQPPRWKRCVAHTAGALGDLVGQMFVRDKFAGESKAAAEQQVQAIVDAMTANLAALPWMDNDTKVRAKAKLDAMSYQIGYPRRWRSYTFKIDRKTWAANAFAARNTERARQLAKIGKPVDKDDWLLTAVDVNAYYEPQLNGMVFPAGILQPPFYSVNAGVAVNLGAMGMVVGHELTHGFDDQGAQYDAVGNLANWWEPATEQQFKQRTQCVVDQYNGYEITGGTKLNGANTTGENIADIGGVKLSLAAYRRLRAPAPETIVADGFTEDQQFFLGFGQAWCAKMRPDYEKLLATVDVHSPPRWRVNGSLQATPEFAAAFRCKARAKMVPAKQCTVW